LLTVTAGNVNVAVAEIVGVKVRVGSEVAVWVAVSVDVVSDVSVNSSVAALIGTVDVGGWAEGAQADISRTIDKMI